jgi:hypothetical protein
MSSELHAADTQWWLMVKVPFEGRDSDSGKRELMTEPQILST